MLQRIAASTKLALKPVSRLAQPVRRMGGGGHDDHHPHLMFDTTTPYNPMGMPLAVLVFIIGGGLAVPAFAFSHHMAMFKGK